MENSRNIKVQTDDMEAGCSALAWETEDGKHLWGRNFDHSRIAEGSRVTYFPRKTEYTTWCRKPGNGERAQSRYACVGTGFTEISSAPVLYEGINEKGLMGGQLYYRGFASYADEARPGTLAVQPPFLVSHCLSQCETVGEVARFVEKDATLVSVPGASRVFAGAVVAYDAAVKIDVLGVDAALVRRVGTVDDEVARQMAAGARRVLGVDVALATTGVAGPGPSEGHPAGTVWVACAGPQGVPARGHLVSGDRATVRARAAAAAIALGEEVALSADGAAR